MTNKTTPRMAPHHWLFTTLVVVGLAWVGITWNHLVWAKADFDGALLGVPTVDVVPAEDALYMEECGGCHFAYPPGLMPARGWDEMMSTLEDHFGDDATLMDEDLQPITDYLINNAADQVVGKDAPRRSVQITLASAGRPVPLRISELPYVKDAHRDIPKKWVDENPKVGGAAYCEACHVQADKGYYNDSNVVIPGYGRWND